MSRSKVACQGSGVNPAIDRESNRIKSAGKIAGNHDAKLLSCALI
jgi:hypothetical protein